MDSSSLHIFAAVARSGSVTAAARDLHTVQSNVTARLHTLERELGVSLFDRHRGGVTLTNAGQVLLPYAIEVEQVLGTAMRAIGDSAVPRGPLRVGSLETTAARRLPPVVSGYIAAYPAVDLRLQTGTTAELMAGVLAYRLEGALVAGPVLHPALTQIPLFEEELVAITAPSCHSLEQALATAGGPTLLVLRTGCSYRERFERFLAARGIVPTRLLEFGMLDAIIGCAAAGLGIALLPRSVVEATSSAAAFAVHDLPAEHARVTTMFIHRAEAFVSSALARFIDACTRQVEELVASAGSAAG